jgi:hypothetical protein
VWVQTAIERAFLPAGGRRIDLTDHLTDHLAAHSRDDAPQPQPSHRDRAALPRPTVLPYWAALITAEPAVADVATGAVVAPDPVRSPVLEDRGDGADLADLAVVNLDGTDADDRLGILAARTLRSGGILAVLARCRHVRHIPGADRGVGGGPDDARGAGGAQLRLVDPTGTVVASAQNADLLYLQHIVIPTNPLPPADEMPTSTSTSHSGTATAGAGLAGTAVPGAAVPGAAAGPAGSAPTDSADTNSADINRAGVEAAHRLPGAAHRHAIAHADLLVFAYPGSAPTGCAPSGSTPFGSTLAGPPGLGSAWRDLQVTGRAAPQLAGAGASADGATP